MTAHPPRNAATADRARAGVLWRMLLASIAILLLAQTLNGVLTWSALRRAATDALTSTVHVVGHDRAFHIENALRLGKPITQMHGLNELLDGLSRDLPFLELIVVTLPDGTPIDWRRPRADASAGAPDATRLRQLLASAGDRSTTVIEADDHRISRMPIEGRRGALAGYLLFDLPDQAIREAMAPTRRENLVMLGGSSLLGAVLLLAGVAIMRRASDAGYARALHLAPFVALLIAQGVYSWHNVTSFRADYVAGVHDSTGRALARFGDELARLFRHGVTVSQLHGLDAPFQRMLDDIPALESVTLLDAGGNPLFTHRRGGGNAGTHLLDDPPPEASDAHRPASDGAPDVRHDVAAGSERVTLTGRLSAERLAEGVRQRILDAGTVVVTSAIFVLELLILLAALMQHQARMAAARGHLPENAPHTRDPPLLARTAAFLLLFAWALPLSFVPLHMAGLPQPFSGLPRDLMLALPVSAEMLLALAGTVLAGRIADRTGWRLPFLAGTLLCAAGAAASALAPEAITFILARALVGLGYGLAWMSLQAHVIAVSPPRALTHAIASLVAGIFAGHMCGSATGGMLAEPFGNASVFLLAGLAGVLPLLFALHFMRNAGATDAEGEDHAVSDPRACAEPPPGNRTKRPRHRALIRLLTDRNYVALLALCVIPFSVVQVGLLYFALPLHLESLGRSPADIGRIQMVYGLSLIYLGPLLGRWLGHFEARKPFIVVGGLAGGLGLALLWQDASVTALVLAVFLLGLASSVGGPAQSAFAMQQPVVADNGRAQALAIQRVADKLGQMLGPLMLGACFALFGSQYGLAVTGTAYMLCAMLFWLIAREPRGTLASAR